MRLDVYIHHVDSPGERRTHQQLEIIMATLQDVLNDVAEESTQIDSLSALTAGIKAQLDQILSGATLPSSVQEQINTLFSGVEANRGKVVAAINANTPAEPSTPPGVTPTSS